MLIRFHNTVFSEPIPLENFKPSEQQGLYVVMLPDNTWIPSPYDPIYIGETGNFSQRGFPKTHEKYKSWIAECGPHQELFISVSPMPHTSDKLRQSIEKDLIAELNPRCNVLGVKS